jgi:hypothetical protein
MFGDLAYLVLPDLHPPELHRCQYRIVLGQALVERAQQYFADAIGGDADA